MRAVPIQFNSDQTTLASLFTYVNGILVRLEEGTGLASRGKFLTFPHAVHGRCD